MRTHGAVTIAVLALAGISGLGGCGQRPLSMVRADANAHYFNGRYEQALPYNSEFVDRKPSDAQGQYELGRTLLALDRPGDARQHLTVAYDLDPRNETYVEALAESMLRSGDSESLYALLRRRVSEQGRVEDHLRLGRFAHRLGNADEAHRAFLNAAEVDGGRTVEPQRTLAEFYRAIGDDDREVERLRMVLFFEPDNPQTGARLRELGYVPGPSFSLPPR